MSKEEILNTISWYIKKNFLYDEKKELNIQASLYETGVIDSMGTIELISFLESNYNIKFDDDELTAENFDSIEKIATFLDKKLNYIK